METVNGFVQLPDMSRKAETLGHLEAHQGVNWSVEECPRKVDLGGLETENNSHYQHQFSSPQLQSWESGPHACESFSNTWT